MNVGRCADPGQDKVDCAANSHGSRIAVPQFVSTKKNDSTSYDVDDADPDDPFPDQRPMRRHLLPDRRPKRAASGQISAS
jgi:hypothetical protein